MYKDENELNRKKSCVYDGQPRHYSSRTAVRQRRHRKRQRQRMIFVTSLAVVVIALIILSISLLSPKSDNKDSPTMDALSGVWVYDQYTKYEFDGYGNGCMCLDDVHYEYTYEIIKNTVQIDFENEAVHDCSYDFTVDENQLTIIGGEGTTGGTYKLNKSKQ